MYTDFFQVNALPPNQLLGIYDPKLVVLSFFVAMMASYVALDLTGRLRDRSNTKKEVRLWLLGGAIAMGSGIWSMHFIGMLSFTIPGLVLKYDLLWTILSLFVAILASCFALFLLKKSIINIVHLLAGGFILGVSDCVYALYWYGSYAYFLKYCVLAQLILVVAPCCYSRFASCDLVCSQKQYSHFKIKKSD
ncbi:sensory box histidine kinase/response regulator [Legionella steelei]|uniref:Sensory box histidine kinase/response regulator n=1 Tax=Legionella steelei TaxID=947033 RepID=A0A0W0ZLD7_9GAMM|nr:MHYT domain-containing protein [Legionella steelei]KTD69686.1 sensory box histidine kinase/response regulator [Legionella steelei]